MSKFSPVPGCAMAGWCCYIQYSGWAWRLLEVHTATSHTAAGVTRLLQRQCVNKPGMPVTREKASLLSCDYIITRSPVHAGIGPKPSVHTACPSCLPLLLILAPLRLPRACAQSVPIWRGSCRCSGTHQPAVGLASGAHPGGGDCGT